MNTLLTLPSWAALHRPVEARSAAHPWLEAGELRRWRVPRPARLQVISGQAWVTCAGTTEDHFLRPGEGLDLGRGADLLIQADGTEPLRWRWAPPSPKRPDPTGAAR